MYKNQIPLHTGGVFHVFTKSIAGYKIFNTDEEYQRMLTTIEYYQYGRMPLRLSHFLNSDYAQDPDLRFSDMGESKLVKVIVYCLMPTHIHLVLEQLAENGISSFMATVLNSYTRFFNGKHRRKGPLWQGRFKFVFVETEEQLLHLTRYVHLNPTTSQLTSAPIEWRFSSYKEYIEASKRKVCDFVDYINIPAEEYKDFVNNYVDYQRDLALIKHLTL